MSREGDNLLPHSNGISQSPPPHISSPRRSVSFEEDDSAIQSIVDNNTGRLEGIPEVYVRPAPRIKKVRTGEWGWAFLFQLRYLFFVRFTFLATCLFRASKPFVSIYVLRVNFKHFICKLTVFNLSNYPHFNSADTRLLWRNKLAYGVGHFYNDLCACMWFTYLLLFFKNVVQLSSAQAGLLMLIGLLLLIIFVYFIIITGQVVDGVATPLVGVGIDHSILPYWLIRRFGRRNSWHLIGVYVLF
jgi:hypothetical protein